MRITSHPVRGSAAAAAIRRSSAFDPATRVHLRFVELNDIAFIGTVSPGPSPAARRRWIHHYKFLEAQGDEFNFVVVESGRDRGLVRMHDFAQIGGQASFRWGDIIADGPGLLTATALMIYALGFDALGFERAHLVVPRSNPALSAFHLGTGAEPEGEDADHQYFRYRLETFERLRNDALSRDGGTVPEDG